MYGNNYFNQQQRFQPTQMPMPSVNAQPYIPPIVQNPSPSGLLGKAVESIDVVKAMDMPLDGSISYFPLTDGSAIVSKQLQTDGTSKVIIYRPAEEEKKDAIKFATLEDLEEAINDIDLSDIQDLKDEIKDIKKQLKSFRTKKGKDD